VQLESDSYPFERKGEKSFGKVTSILKKPKSESSIATYDGNHTPLLASTHTEPGWLRRMATPSCGGATRARLAPRYKPGWLSVGVGTFHALFL
jgi:hypothetical protein